MYYTNQAIVFKPAVNSTGHKSELKSRTTSFNQHLPLTRKHLFTSYLISTSPKFKHHAAVEALPSPVA